MINRIAEIVENNATLEKIVICPDSASAKFIKRQLLSRTKGLANLKFETVSGLASRCAGFFIIEEGGRILRPGEGLLLLQGMVSENGYFGASLAMPGFLLALWNSLMQLRLAEITPENLNEKTLGNAQKASELAGLLGKFQNCLEDSSSYDYTRILKTCITHRFIARNNVQILLPGNLSLQPLEQRFLNQAGENLVHLPWSANEDMQTPSTWRQKTRKNAFASSPGACLSPKIDPQIFCATEPQAEIREIIRRIRSADIPFEQIAIATVDSAGYSGLISAWFDISAIPYSLSLPRKTDEFRPGRLATSLCQWVSDGFPSSALIAMLNQGDLRLFRPLTRKQREEGRRSISSQKIISLLRRAHVRGGRDGYEKPLLAVGEKSVRRGQSQILRQSRRVVKRIQLLLNSFPDEITPGEVAMKLRDLVARYTRIADEKDSIRLSRIKKQLESYRNIQTPLLPLSRAMWWLQLVLRQESDQEPFKPDGKVLITTPQAAVISGRRLLFFPGLAHAAMPGNPPTDPVIPDSCRKLLPPLITAEECRAQTLGTLYNAWADITDDTAVVVSLPLVDATGRATSPAEPFTRILHRKAGSNKEFSRLINTDALPLVGHFSESGQAAIDLSEWLWQKRRKGYSRESLREVFEHACPAWAKHGTSQEQRKTGQGAVITGLPDWQAEKWDYRNNPDKTISASGIKELSGCKYAYFLSHVIGCMPWEKLDSTGLSGVAWLDAAQRGNLLHEIYEIFLKRSGWPVNQSHSQLLKQVVDEITEKYRNLIPPSGLSAFVVGRAAIHRDAVEFFTRECEAASAGAIRPVGFELMFGLDTAESVLFTMGDGSKVNLMGMVDRIDETSEGLKIWDYKTGSAHNYQKGGKRSEQAALQMAIYKYAVSELLKGRNDSRKVLSAGLYFPTVAGQGQRIIMTDGNEQEIINNRLEGLFDFLTEGRFPAESLCEDCNAQNLCPYAAFMSEPKPEENGEEE